MVLLTIIQQYGIAQDSNNRALRSESWIIFLQLFLCRIYYREFFTFHENYFLKVTFMIKNTRNHNKIFLFILILSCIIITVSCGKSKTIKLDKEAAWKKDALLEKVYKKIIIQRFEIDQDLEKDLPDAAVICESTVMNELLKKDVTSQIEKSRLSTSREAGALIVKARITILKLASSSAHGLGGAYVGNSEMAADIKLIDAETGRTLRKKNLSTSNNSYTSSATGTGSDRIMPSDLGKMIAEYIAESVHGN